MFEIVAKNLISLCMLIVIGYAAGKAGIINEKASSVLSDVLLKIALPCTIIMSMQKPFSFELLKDGGIVFGVSVLIYIASFAVGVVACRLLQIKMPREGVWIFALMFPNVGYMGYPVLNAVYGSDILFFVSMNNIVFNILSSTAGIAIVKYGAGFFAKGEKVNKKQKEKKKWKDRNLLPAATAIGFVLFLMSAVLPEPAADALKMGGNMTTPLSMIIIGGLLSRGRFKEIFAFGKEYTIIVLKLIILPVLTFAAVSPFIHDKYMLGTLVLLTAMPVSAVTAIFTSKYSSEGFLGSKLVALSTIMSLITLPVISMLL